MKLKKSIVNKIAAIKDVAELYTYMQNAIELEHATIPVYLTGLLSIKQGLNAEVRNIIRSVVVEEMLHMSIACNVLNAIGGSPDINKPDFVPKFPGPLPMGVGEDRGLNATLEKVSKEQVFKVYMGIEEPEDVQHFPVKAAFAAEDDDEYSTIGEFYQAIIDKICELGDGIFIGDQNKQMVNHKWFPKDELFAITNVKTAVAGLQLIVRQGEGYDAGKDPIDPEGQPAHYYRFAEIYYGKKLVKDPSAPDGFSFSGAPVVLDENGVYDLKPNAKAADYPPGSMARRMADQTNQIYSNLLNNLHLTFNGSPERIDQAMGLMYEFRLSVQKMVTIELGNGQNAAPPFQYVLE